MNHLKEPLPRIVEMYYTPADLAALWRFSVRKISDMCKRGDFTVKAHDGTVTAEPMEIAGEIRIPASGINHYAATHPYTYNLGVKARNRGELMRKIAA